MPLLQLRQGTVDDIHRGMERGFLTRYSFTVASNGDDGCILHLTYRDEPGCEFKVLQPNSQLNPDGNWKTSECPGRHLTTAEVFAFSDLSGAINSAYSWADRIVADAMARLRAQGASASMGSDFRHAIEKAADALDAPGEAFSAEEADGWIEKFKALAERLESLEGENAAHRGALDRISRELDELRRQAPDVPKRAWLKKVGNRFMDFVESTAKEGGKTLANGAAKLLLDYFKDGGGTS